MTTTATRQSVRDLIHKFGGDGFSLARRVDPPFKPKLHRELWTDGETVLLFEHGKIRKVTIKEALKQWNLPTDEDADPSWCAAGEEKWIRLLRNQLFIELTPAERSAVEVCAVRYEGGDVAKYVRRALTTDLACDLGEVADALKGEKV